MKQRLNKPDIGVLPWTVDNKMNTLCYEWYEDDINWDFCREVTSCMEKALEARFQRPIYVTPTKGDRNIHFSVSHPTEIIVGIIPAILMLSPSLKTHFHKGFWYGGDSRNFYNYVDALKNYKREQVQKYTKDIPLVVFHRKADAVTYVEKQGGILMARDWNITNPGSKEFLVFEDDKGVYDYHQVVPPEHCHLYDVLRGPVPLFLDLEWTNDYQETPSQLDSRLRAIADICREILKIGKGELTFNRVSHHRVKTNDFRGNILYKHSYHLICHNIVFNAVNDDYREFLRSINRHVGPGYTDTLMYMKDEDPALIIDTGTYKKDQLFRVTGSTKILQPQSGAVPRAPDFKEFQERRPITTRQPNAKLRRQKKLKAPRVANMELSADLSKYESTLINWVNPKLIKNDWSTVNLDDERLIVNVPFRKEGCQLVSSDRKHLSKQQYFDIDVISGLITFRCRSSHCEWHDVVCWLGGATVDWGRAEIKEMSLRDDFEDQSMNNRFIQNIQLHDLPPRLLIRAEPGLGKTEWFKRTILPQAQDLGFNTLVITTRRTNTHAFCESTGLISYLEDRTNFQVVSLESIHLLAKTKPGSNKIWIPPVHILMLEEVRGLVAQIASHKTNGKRHEDNVAIFKAIVENANHVIGSDADLEADCSVSDLFNHFKPAPTVIHRYNDRPASKKRRFRLTRDLVKFLHVVKGDLERHHKIMIAAHQKAGINALVTELRELAGRKLKIKIYTSDSPSSVKADFKDINAALNDVDVVIATSVVSIGVSFTLFPFNAAYIYAPKATGPLSGAVARDMRQLINRVRSYTGNVVYCLVSFRHVFNERVIDYDELVARKRNAFRCITTGIINRMDVSGNDDGWIPIDRPDPKETIITTCYNHSEHEKHVPFVLSLIHLAKKCGDEIFIDSESLPNDKGETNLTVTSFKEKSVKTAVIEECFDFISPMDIDTRVDLETKERLDIQMDRSENPMRSKILLQVIHALKKGVPERKDLIVHYVKNKDQVDTFHWLHFNEKQLENFYRRVLYGDGSKDPLSQAFMVQEQVTKPLDVLNDKTNYIDYHIRQQASKRIFSGTITQQQILNSPIARLERLLPIARYVLPVLNQVVPLEFFRETELIQRLNTCIDLDPNVNYHRNRYRVDDEKVDPKLIVKTTNHILRMADMKMKTLKNKKGREEDEAVQYELTVSNETEEINQAFSDLRIEPTTGMRPRRRKRIAIDEDDLIF